MFLLCLDVQGKVKVIAWQKTYQALRRQHRDVAYFLLDSDYGHDAFLTEQDRMLSMLRRFVGLATTSNASA